MKATDQEIIHAVWRETLKRIAERGFECYTMKYYAVKEKGLVNIHDIYFATSLQRAGRRGLKINLCDSQLLRRLKGLSVVRWIHGCELYLLDSPHRESAFLRAQDLYREYGLSDRPQPFTDEKIKSIMKSVETTLLDEWLGVFPKGEK